MARYTSSERVKIGSRDYAVITSVPDNYSYHTTVHSDTGDNYDIYSDGLHAVAVKQTDIILDPAPRKVHFNATLNEDVAIKLRKLAKSHGMTGSAYISGLITSAYDAEKAQPEINAIMDSMAALEKRMQDVAAKYGKTAERKTD